MTTRLNRASSLRLSPLGHVLMAIFATACAVGLRLWALYRGASVHDFVSGVTVRSGYPKLADLAVFFGYWAGALTFYVGAGAFRTTLPGLLFDEFNLKLFRKETFQRVTVMLGSVLQILIVGMIAPVAAAGLLPHLWAAGDVIAGQPARATSAIVSFAIVAPISIALIIAWRRRLHQKEDGALVWHALWPVAMALALPAGKVLTHVIVPDYGAGLMPLAAFIGLICLMAVSTQMDDVSKDKMLPSSADFSAVAIGAWLAFLSPYAVLRAISALIKLPKALTSGWFVNPLCSLTAILFILAMRRFNERTPSICQTRRRWFFWLQILGAATLLMQYIPSRWMNAKGEILFTPSLGWYVVIFALTVFIVAAMAKHLRCAAGTAVSGLIAPVSLALLMVWMRFSFGPDATLSSDDFHFGESITPYWQISSLGMIPYVDFFPAHGFLDLASSWLGHALGAQGALAESMGNQLILVASLISLFFVLSRTTSPYFAFLLTLFVPVNRATLLFVGAILIALFESTPSKRPLLLVLITAVLSTVLLLFEVITGGALAIALTPACVLWAWQSFRVQPWRTFAAAVGGGAALLVVACLPHAADLCRGLLWHVRAIGPNNLEAFGTAWPKASLSVLEEITRTAWIVVIPGLLTIAWASRKSDPKWAGRWFGLALFCVPLSSYAFGRIDGVVLTRMAFASILTFSLCLPAWIFAVVPRASFFLTGLFAVLAPTELLTMPARAWTGSAAVSGQLAASAPSWASHIGPAVFDDNHKEFLRSTVEKINELLRPGETFWDLTNRGALQWYANRIPPSPYSSVYIVASTAQQERLNDDLQRRRALIPVILTTAESIRHDGLMPLERTPIPLQTFLREGYRLAWWDKLGVLLSPDRADNLRRGKLGNILRFVNSPAEHDEVLSQKDLGALAITWGASWQRLESLVLSLPLTAQLSLDDRSKDVSAAARWTINWGTSSHDSELTRPDFLTISMSEGETPVDASFWFEWSNGASMHVKFRARNGLIVLPIEGLASQWLAPEMRSVTIELARSTAVLSDPKLWRRRGRP